MSLLTPQPKDLMPDDCEGHDNPCDGMGGLDHGPDHLAVRDEAT